MEISKRDELVLKRINNYPHTLGKRVAFRFYNFDNLSTVGKTYVAENLLYLAQLVDNESRVQ